MKMMSFVLLEQYSVLYTQYVVHIFTQGMWYSSTEHSFMLMETLGPSFFSLCSFQVWKENGALLNHGSSDHFYSHSGLLTIMALVLCLLFCSGLGTNFQLRSCIYFRYFLCLSWFTQYLYHQIMKAIYPSLWTVSKILEISKHKLWHCVWALQSYRKAKFVVVLVPPLPDFGKFKLTS